MLGGNGALDAMLYMRPQPADVAAWPGWSWSDVQPFVKRSEAMLQPEHFISADRLADVQVQAAKERGFAWTEDFLADPVAGYGFAKGLVANGARVSAAKAYLKRVPDNLHVIKYAEVSRVIIGDGGVATGVEFLLNGTVTLTANARRDVLLTAGPINTPKILLKSGIGSGKHLTKLGVTVRNDLPAVGRNLQDMLAVPVFYQLQSASQQSKTDLLDSIYAYAITKTGPLTNHGATELIAFLSTSNATNRPQLADVHVRHHSHVRNAVDLQFQLVMAGYEEIIGRQIMDANQAGDLLVAQAGLLRPTSRGSVTLRPGMDTVRIDAKHLQQPRDVNTLLRAVKMLAETVNSDTFKTNEARLVRLPLADCKTLEYQSDEYWKCYIAYMARSMGRQFGSARMGTSAADSVVDARLMVHGTRSLRVIGSAAMPTATTGPTVAMTVAMAERAAELVRQEWSEKADMRKDEL